MFILTQAETTQPRHDLNFILAQARDVVNDRSRGRITKICTNAVPAEDHGTSNVKYTTNQASDMIENIVSDTFYYS